MESECKAQSIEQCHFRFSRRHVREFTAWSDGQLKIHCKRLEEMEYLLVHRGGRGQSMEYELLYNGEIDSDQTQLMGLLKTDSLKKHHYGDEKLGQKSQKLAPSQGQVRPKSDSQKSLQATNGMAYSDSGLGSSKNALRAL